MHKTSLLILQNGLERENYIYPTIWNVASTLQFFFSFPCLMRKDLQDFSSVYSENKQDTSLKKNLRHLLKNAYKAFDRVEWYFIWLNQGLRYVQFKLLPLLRMIKDRNAIIVWLYEARTGAGYGRMNALSPHICSRMNYLILLAGIC